MVAKKSDYAESASLGWTDAPAELQPLFTMEVARVVYETVPVHPDVAGVGIGRLVEDYIAMNMREGNIVQSLTLNFTREQWDAMK
jgi:hypothetical protein